MNEIVVFTDGSFMKKLRAGEQTIFCGYGIYFPNNELSNISRPFRRPPFTNQRAELFAIYVAVLLVKKHFPGRTIHIYTDSEYSINSLTKWAYKWEKNGWHTSSGQNVENQDIIKPLFSVIKQITVIFSHVLSHTGNNDAISMSNNFVDKLAKEGAKSLKIKIDSNKKIEKNNV